MSETTVTANIAAALLPLVVPLDELRTLEGNPRRGDVESVMRSYERFGQRKPVVARRGLDGIGEVLAGNHQLEAARRLGWSHIAVVWTEDDDATAPAFALADNRTHDLGHYDDRALADMLEQVRVADGDLLASTGYGLDDLGDLLAGLDAESAPPERTSTRPFDIETIVDRAVEHYRRVGFPYRAMPVHECMAEINRLAEIEDASLPNSNVGYGVADNYHPHRLAVPVDHATYSPVAAFEVDKILRAAVRWCLEQGGKITDRDLVSTLGYVRGGTGVAANFRPAFALSIYRRFAGPGATVLDTSTGFGGRLVGFLASPCSGYIGIDPSSVTSEGNRRLAHDLSGDKAVVLIEQPAEDVAPEVIGSVDLAFTSPPYFAAERYADEPTQSCVRYPDGPSWRDGFLRPLMRLQARCVRSGGHAIVNIADTKVGPTSYPLVDWTMAAAEEVGLTFFRMESLPLSRVPGQGEKMKASEPVLIFRQP